MRSPVSRRSVLGGAMLALMSLHLFLAQRVEAANGPFNGKIAFVSTRDYATGSYEIYTMNANGTSQVNISNNPAQDTSPAWSPDGTKIAFQSDRDASGKFEIYVMNADGSNQTRLTFSPLSDEHPAWSPDGTKIAFQSERDDAGSCSGEDCLYHPDIYVMNADGTGTVRLTNHPNKDSSPSWSPDGTKIAFESDRSGNFEIYVINADGSGQTQLTNNTGQRFSPGFSPDGTKIVFGDGNQVFVMNADGTSQTQLTSSGFNADEAFSPDGKKITFESGRDGNYELYAMNADGSNQTRLITNPATDFEPRWQPVPKIDTVGVFRPSTGQFLLRNSNTSGPPNVTVNFGQSGDQPLAGDWNGDGIDDVGVFRNGQFRLRQPVIFNGQPTNVASTIVVNFGAPGDLAIVGDWNGDGIDTPGVFRPSTGQFLFTNSDNVNNSTPRASSIAFRGDEGDKPVAGDWDNDGRDTFGVYKESSACGFFLTNNNFSINIIATGFCAAPPVSPVMGDWNGNGVDTNGVYSGSQAVFNLSNNLTGPPQFQVSFGQAGDLPVAGDWNGGNP
jgi:Tol biopolymer transport system component